MLPPDLQNAIAFDTLQGYAGLAAQQGGLDPGVILAEAKLGRPLTQTDMQDQNVMALVQSVDASLQGGQSPGPAQPGSSDGMYNTTSMDQTGPTGQPGATSNPGDYSQYVTGGQGDPNLQNQNMAYDTSGQQGTDTGAPPNGVIM
jgi:hypothetical protein